MSDDDSPMWVPPARLRPGDLEFEWFGGKLMYRRIPDALPDYPDPPAQPVPTCLKGLGE